MLLEVLSFLSIRNLLGFLYYPVDTVMFHFFHAQRLLIRSLPKLSKTGNSFYKQHPGWLNVLCNTIFRTPFLISQFSIAKVMIPNLVYEKANFYSQLWIRPHNQKMGERQHWGNQGDLFTAVLEQISWSAFWRKSMDGAVSFRAIIVLPLLNVSDEQRERQENWWLKILRKKK